MDCIFCKIANGEIDSAKVSENDNTVVFLDIKPVTKGHCLIIPKEHYESIFDIKEEILKEIISTAKLISQKLKNVLKADGIRLTQSSGKAAGQEVMHFHLHVIPRYLNDGMPQNPALTVKAESADFEDLNNLAVKITQG